MIWEAVNGSKTLAEYTDPVWIKLYLHTCFFVLYRFLLYPSLNRLYLDTGADYRLLAAGTFYAPIIIISAVIFFRVVFHSLSKPWKNPFLYDGIELAVAVILLVSVYFIDRGHRNMRWKWFLSAR